MKRQLSCLVALGFAAALFASIPSGAGAAAAVDKDKEAAMKEPYPNDLGPATLTEAELKAYPASIRQGYNDMLAKCGVCHTTSRPLNSRFVEVEGGKDEAKQKANIAALKKSNPELFADYSVWQIESRVWARYVNRMMEKPGCALKDKAGKPIKGKDGKPVAAGIYEFLARDSQVRKLGANAKKWEAHRKKLIEDFKAKHPERYKTLSAAKDL